MLGLPDNTTTTLGDSPVGITLLALEILLFLWIILANFALWITLRITAAFHIPLNYILASLILTNYLFAASSLPFELINLGLLFRWRFGKGLCELWHAFDLISRTAFPWFLLMLAIERWVFCRHKVWYQSQKKSAAIIGIVLTWIIVIFVCIIAFAIEGQGNFNDRHDYNACYWSEQNWNYALYHSLSSFFVPTFLALILYLILVCWLGTKTSKEIHPSRPPTDAAMSRQATSLWSDMSLPQTPSHSRPTSSFQTRPSSSQMELTPVVTNKIAPITPSELLIGEAWGSSAPPVEFHWEEVLFSKMFRNKTAVKAPTEKPVLNEDLIKTLPTRNPRLLPRLGTPQNLPPIEIAVAPKKEILSKPLKPIENNPKDTNKDSDDNINKPQNQDDTLVNNKHGKCSQSQASFGGGHGGRDSGFEGSNSAGSDKQGTVDGTSVVDNKATNEKGKETKETEGENKRHDRSRRASKWSVMTTHGAKSVIVDNTSMHSDDESQNDDELTITPSLKLNSIKWLWLLFLIYVICWCPFYVMYLFLAGSFSSSSSSSSPISWDLYAGLRLVGALNSALNPLILLLVIREYRQALVCLLRWRDPNSLYAHMQADWDDDIEDDDEDEEPQEEEMKDFEKEAKKKEERRDSNKEGGTKDKSDKYTKNKEVTKESNKEIENKDEGKNSNKESKNKEETKDKANKYTKKKEETKDSNKDSKKKKDKTQSASKNRYSVSEEDKAEEDIEEPDEFNTPL